jgi:hypothetical protein
MAMNFWSTRNGIALVYLLGNALTYRHLVQADPTHALDYGTIFQNLLLSFLWPLYWLLQSLP